MGISEEALKKYRSQMEEFTIAHNDKIHLSGDPGSLRRTISVIQNQGNIKKSNEKFARITEDLKNELDARYGSVIQSSYSQAMDKFGKDLESGKIFSMRVRLSHEEVGNDLRKPMALVSALYNDGTRGAIKVEISNLSKVHEGLRLSPRAYGHNLGVNLNELRERINETAMEYGANSREAHKDPDLNYRNKNAERKRLEELEAKIEEYSRKGKLNEIRLRTLTVNYTKGIQESRTVVGVELVKTNGSVEYMGGSGIEVSRRDYGQEPTKYRANREMNPIEEVAKRYGVQVVHGKDLNYDVGNRFHRSDYDHFDSIYKKAAQAENASA